jgi:hypothetical protein
MDVTLTLHTGDDIKEALAKAMKISKAINEPVSFEGNGEVITVNVEPKKGRR